jgi:uncharacterized protein with GYD domain
MAVFLMFGKYSSEAMKGISAGRTKEAVAIIDSNGGSVISMYALLSDKDLVLITEFPGIKEVMKASVALTKLTGIAFTTSPAVPVEDFDKMI